jgi:hypothetical protein
MMDDKLRAERMSLLTASLRDQNVHRHTGFAELRGAFFRPAEDARAGCPGSRMMPSARPAR